jgi:hypothetical protein
MLPITIATIDAPSETERLILVLAPCDQDGQCLELARQTFCEALGWFTQSRVRIARDEVNGLRSALGIVPGTKRKMASTSAPAILQFPAQHSA